MIEAKTPKPEFRWEVPSPYNYAAAVDSMGTIGAPLLAGVSIALIAVVIASATAIRWVNATLFLLVLAVASFVAAVEFSFHARQYAVTPSDLEAWWPDHAVPARREQLRSEQRVYYARLNGWSRRARAGYNVGTLSLSLAVTVLLVPRGALAHASYGRLAVVALAAAGFLAELAWIGVGIFRPQTIPLVPVGPERSLEETTPAGS